MFDGDYYSVYSGLGLDVPFTAKGGATKVAQASTATNCTDAAGGAGFALQQMLNDLGFGPLAVDGQVGNATLKAVKAFASANGVPYAGGFPKGQICDALMAAWQAKNAPHPAPQPSPSGPLKPGALLSPGIINALHPASSSAHPMAHVGGATATIGSWWAARSTVEKVGIGVGAALAVLLVGKLVMGGGKKEPATMTPNRRRKAKTRRRSKCAMPGVRTCRCKPPKGYSKQRSKYALPECWMYDLGTRQRVKNAASRFGKYGHRYPHAIRAKIARRLDAAKRRYGIGEYR